MGIGFTGVPVEEIEALARDYGATEQRLSGSATGFRSPTGPPCMLQVACGDTGCLDIRRWAVRVYRSELQPEHLGSDRDRRPDVRRLDMSRLGPILIDEPEPERRAAVTAMLVQSPNRPSLPESAKVRNGLMKDEMFLCVHEQFLTDTAKLAISSPATTFLNTTIFIPLRDPIRRWGRKY